MGERQARGKIRLNGREVEALFDTGMRRSVVPKSLALELGCYRELPEEDRYGLEVAGEGVKLRIIGKCDVIPEVAGCKIPSTTLEVSEDVREVVIGRPELDEWDIVFTPEGSKLRKYPITFDLI